MEITLTIDRQSVYKEVEKSTNYTGAKMDGDVGAYERIRTIDEDLELLQRFWDESRAEVAQSMIRVLLNESMEGEKYLLKLNVSAAFEEALLPSMQLSLFSFFIQSIVSKWFVFTNKKEAGEYADRASVLIEDVREKAFFKKKPKRPTYN